MEIELLFRRGQALLQRGQVLAAAGVFEQVQRAAPNHFGAAHYLAQLRPNNPGYLIHRGKLLFASGQLQTALNDFDRIIALAPKNTHAHIYRGMALIGLHQYQAAVQSFDVALVLDPTNAVAYNNRGAALSSLTQFEAAAQSLSKAIELGMNQPATYNNLAIALFLLKRYDGAIVNYEKVFELDADYVNLRGGLLFAKMHICNWENQHAAVDGICARVTEQRNVVSPFVLLAAVDSPPLHRYAAAVYANSKHPASPILGPIASAKPTGRIRLGYYSADFHGHATAYLMAELIERHDRSQFELVAFSFGPDVQDTMRTRLVAAFDKFVDVRQMRDIDVAKLSREMAIDVAVDLNGYTEDCRPGIFAARAAPLQVNYLGYPGTMGVDYMDYILGDATVIPAGSREHYTEKVVTLPHCYQPNDRRRKVSERVFTRAELGLPERGVVFCCFNNNFKISPLTFDGWMRIMHRVDGSVLWLLEDNSFAAENLRKEAQVRGIDPQRLVFAQRIPLDEHLARQRLADLFIDTLPYNAHTTASDALWVCLPVLTCMGESFSSRVAASLLKAVGMSELVAPNQQAFEDMAVELADNPGKLSSIRERLARNRLITPLFDAELFAQHIEQAYIAMHHRHLAGLPPDHIDVSG